MKYDVLVIKENLANYYVRTNSKTDYSNSVTAGKDSHTFYRAMIVNKYMREDMENGAFTKGALFAYGDYFYRISGPLWRLSKILDRLKTARLINLVRNLIGK